MYQILMKDAEGRSILIKGQMNEQEADNVVNMLTASGVEAKKVRTEEKKWQVSYVVFDIQLVPAAKKAFKENREMKGLYVFGDPDELSEVDHCVWLDCSTGERKVGYVIGTRKLTRGEIQIIKQKIKYPKLSLVVQKV